jgi:hypothetical protein
MSPANPVLGARLLLISGLPGSGKTQFVRWLGDHGWGTFIGDDPDASGVEVHAAWDLARAGDDRLLLAEAAKHPAGFAIEWGFPATHIRTVEDMLIRGYDGWFFDGDREAALTCWRKVDPLRTDEVWRRQVDGIDSISDRIDALYAGRRIITINRGPTWLTPRDICLRIGLSVDEPALEPADAPPRATRGSWCA